MKRLAIMLALWIAPATYVAPAEAAPRTYRCSDGTIVRRAALCPRVTPSSTPAPTPSPTPTPTTSPLLGAAPVKSEFNPALALVDTGIPPSNAPDPLGAFRFICGAGQLLRDDPIVYPGQPGRSHLHQFYGNLSVNGSSTFESLRAAGESTCNQGQYAANRSGYWMPAMLDGMGHVVRPDYVSLYYKRRPDSDPMCNGDAQSEGICVALPNGLKFIFGYNMLNPADTPTGSLWWNCDGPSAQPGHYANITEAVAHCPTALNANGAYNRLGAIIEAPSCWDGKNLDSADHRSHVAYASRGDWGFLKCPLTHPYVIPRFTLGAWYTVDQNLGTWHLSSDEMLPGAIPGTTFHADYFEGWDATVKAMWTDGCVNKMLNCNAGDLGNGKRLRGAGGPIYTINGVLTSSWTHPQRLVPIP